MVYKWKPASYIKVDAQIAGEQCAELERTVGLTAKNLVNANREEDAPLHSEFEWQDDVAAELYRENQARHIINCLAFTVESEQKEITNVRAFLKVESASPAYENIPSVMSDAEKRAKAINIAISELLAVKRKYEWLTELENIFTAITDVAGNFKEN